MNNYITLDGKRYHAAHDSWEPNEERPMVVRRLMSARTNVTFGPATFTGWSGIVMVDVTPQASFGSLADFRATYRKRTALTFVDFEGTSHSVVIDRRVGEKSISPVHDAPDNTFRMNLALIKL